MATLNELITKVSEQRDVLVLNLNEAGVTSINSETLNVLVPKVLLVKKDLTPLIVVTVETGAIVTATNESAGKALQETSVDGSVQFNIDDFGTWTISATKDGQTSNEVEVLVERDEREISLSFFSAIVTVNAETGSQVTLKNNNTFNQTISASNGKAIFTVPAAGSYTASATFDGIPSNTQQVEVVESGGSYSATLNYIKLTVNCPEGSLIIVSKDGYSYSQTASSGSYMFRLPETGVWNIEISLDTQSASGTVNCNSYTNFSISLSYFAVYGVRIALNNSNPETSVEYIDGATGMTPGWDNWKDKRIFKDIKPCVLGGSTLSTILYYLNRDNYTLKENGEMAEIGDGHNVMVEFPKIGYKMAKDSNYQYIWVTDNPNAEGFCYLAHSLDSEGDCDKIYIGAYLAHRNIWLFSSSGVLPISNITLTSARNYLYSNNFQLLSFYSLTLLQCLYVIIYKNLNSQQALGQGYTSASAKANTGSTNTKPFCYGNPNSGTEHVKFLGIEDFYGNLYQWVDGLYCDSSYNIKTDYNNFTGTDGSAFRYSQSSGISSNIFGYTSRIQGTNNTGFILKSAAGSTSTYYAEYAYLVSGCFSSFGGYWSYGAFAGAFLLDVYYAASYSSSSLGCRVVYKHKQS